MKPKVIHKMEENKEVFFPYIGKCGAKGFRIKTKSYWSKVTCRRCLAMRKRKRK